jgi:uncharacterized repeat protein (TIGR01451 family)
MKKVYLLAAASVVTTALVLGAVSGTAVAWHPEGKIKKWVQNVTANGQLTDAEDEEDAVEAKPGDTLKYVVKVWNEGEAHEQGHNDMVNIVMTDNLPDGVEFVSGAKEVEKIDRLEPGESKTFEYTVKVVKDEEGIIENTACFTGDSEVEDAPQEGCADANVRVKIPTGRGGEEPKKQAVLPATLPETGAGSVAGLFAGVSGLGYGLHRLAVRFKRNK